MAEQELEIPDYGEVVKCHCGEPAVGKCPLPWCDCDVCAEHLEAAAQKLAEAMGLRDKEKV